MKADLRKSGIEIIGEVPWGTHFCQFYQGKEDLIEILVPYFKQGLENNEFCMWVTSEPLGAEDAKKALKEKVKNLDEYIKKEQIEILDYSQWYTKTGRFDADKVLEGWVEKEKQAIGRGFDGLRLTGNTFWLEKKDWENFTDYEAIVNSVIGKHRMLAVCSYSLDKCQASEIVDVVSNHQFAIIKKESKWVSLESSECKKAEEEIQSLSQQIEFILGATKTGLDIIDSGLNMVYIDPVWAQVYGDHKGRKCYEYFMDRSEACPNCGIKKALGLKEVVVSEEVLVKEGNRPIQVTTIPFQNEKGEWLVAEVNVDITERKRAEEKTKIFSDAVDSAFDYLFLTDIKGNITYANESAVRAYGYTIEELLKLNINKLDANPEDGKKVLQNMLTKGKWSGDVINLRKNKEKFHTTLSAFIIKDKEGNPRGTMGILRDITERKKAEEALQKSVRLLEDTGEMAKVGGWELDLSTKEVSWTEEVGRIHGVGPGYKPKLEEALNFYPPESRPAVEAAVKKAAETGEPYDLESLFISSGSKDKIWVRSLGRAVYSGGKIVKLAGTFQNIDKYKRAEEALRASEVKHRTLLESLPQKIFMKDRNSVYISCNENYARDLNIKSEEITGKTDYEFYPKDLAEKYRVDDKRVMESGKTEDIEESYIQGGQERSVYTVKASVRDDQGNVVGMLGIFWDITERKNMEEALRRNEARYRSSIELTGQLAWTTDSNGEVVEDIPLWRKFTGLSYEETKGSGWTKALHPEDTEHTRQVWDKAVKDKSVYETEYRLRRFDGVYRDFLTRGIPVFKEDGNIREWVGVNIDITERKRIEEALRESQKKYMDLFENANDSIYTMDLTGKFFSFNRTAAKMLGYSEEEFSRLNMKDCLTPESYASAVQSIQKAVTEKSDLKELQPWEFKMIKKDGTIIDTEVRTRLIWEEGQIIGIHGIARNITQRKRTDEELRLAYKKLQQTQHELIQASKMAAMGQLAAGISHELNQPLTGIKGFTQAVLMDLEKESPFRNDLNKIVGQVDRMDTIIKNVRFFARKSDFKIADLDINQVVIDSLMLLGQQLKVHNIRVIQELGLDMPKIQGDHNQLQQAFLNIISNSRDAILSLNRPEGGEICIRTSLSQDKNHIEITFHDTGCGIHEDNFQHIFSPFFTTKSPDKGVGLGLSITYRIIENHHGKIECKSKEGQGTTFNIVFPLQGTKHKIKQS